MRQIYYVPYLIASVIIALAPVYADAQRNTAAAEFDTDAGVWGWFSRFNDPVLDSLLSVACARNYDVSATAHKIQAASKSLGITRSAYFPSVDLQGGWNKTSTSGEILSPPSKGSSTDYFSLGLSASWEIDIFGRTASVLKGDRANFEIARAQRRGALVSLCSNVAQAYFQLRMYQAEKAVAQKHIESESKIVAMTEARHEAGLASMLDVRQARLVLLSTQASIPALDALIQASINALTTMIGDADLYNNSFADYGAEINHLLTLPNNNILNYNGGIPDISYELLRSRPDVVEAEQQIAVAAAALGISRKEYLPSLSISGSVGTSAHNIKNLFSRESFTWSVAPTLSWNVFDGLAREYRCAQDKENMLAAIDSYNSTLLSAFEDIRNAGATYNSELETIKYMLLASEESSKALELAVDMYREGLTPFSNVVDAQVSLLQYEDQTVTAKGKMLIALATLYSAIGGF